MRTAPGAVSPDEQVGKVERTQQWWGHSQDAKIWWGRLGLL